MPTHANAVISFFRPAHPTTAMMALSAMKSTVLAARFQPPILSGASREEPSIRCCQDQMSGLQKTRNTLSRCSESAQSTTWLTPLRLTPRPRTPTCLGLPFTDLTILSTSCSTVVLTSSTTTIMKTSLLDWPLRIYTSRL